MLHTELQVQTVHQFVKVGGVASMPTGKEVVYTATLPLPLAPPTPTVAPPTFLQSSTREHVASSSRGCSVVEPTRLCCQWADRRLHRLRAML